MGSRAQRIPSWPGVIDSNKAVYICADQLVTDSLFACGGAADHTFRFADNPRVDRQTHLKRLVLVEDLQREAQLQLFTAAISLQSILVSTPFPRESVLLLQLS